MDVITLRFHHGGKLVKNGDITDYVGGNVTELCKFDPDYITGPGISDFVSTSLGSMNVKNVYYLIPGMSLAEGLRAVCHDKGVIEMCEYGKKNPVVEIYSDHDVVQSIGESRDDDIISISDSIEFENEGLVDIKIGGNESNQGEQQVEVDLIHNDDEEASEYEVGEGETDDDSDSNCDWLVESDEELLSARENVRAAKEKEKREKKRDKRRRYVEEETEIRQNENDGRDEGGLGAMDEGCPSGDAWQEVDWASDELHTPETSDDEVRASNIKKRKCPEYNPKTDIKNVQFAVGMKFANHKEFKEAVKQYAIGKQYNVHFPKNARDKVQVKCVDGCPWSLWASCLKHENNFTVKKYNNLHKCTNKQKNRQVTARFLANHYYEKIKACPYWKLSEFQWDVKKQLSVKVSLSQCYRAREIALKRAYATVDDVYGQLWDYEKELNRANKGSTFEIKVDRKSPEEPGRFQRFYIGFDALKKG